MGKIKVGIFGMKRGRRFIKFLLNLSTEIVAVCDRNIIDFEEFFNSEKDGYSI
jgi:predicted dehydrogenase